MFDSVKQSKLSWMLETVCIIYDHLSYLFMYATDN